jgi:hypothetical protein
MMVYSQFNQAIMPFTLTTQLSLTEAPLKLNRLKMPFMPKHLQESMAEILKYPNQTKALKVL